MKKKYGSYCTDVHVWFANVISKSDLGAARTLLLMKMVQWSLFLPGAMLS